jgi:carboxyl-terminal processing protease
MEPERAVAYLGLIVQQCAPMARPDHHLLGLDYSVGLGFWTLLLSSALAVAGWASEPAPSPDQAGTTARPSDNARVRENAEVFDAAWRIINDTYVDPTFHGLDWNQVRAELAPKAREAASVQELRLVIEGMLARLGDSHMALIPGDVSPLLESSPTDDSIETDAAETSSARPSGRHNSAGKDGDSSSERAPMLGEGQLGLDVRLLEGRVVVTTVEVGGPAASAGVRPGWIVSAIGARPVEKILRRVPEGMSANRAQFLAWRAVMAALSGDIGSAVKVQFLDQQNRPVTLSLERARESGDPAKLGYLPTFHARFEGKSLPTLDGGLVGYMRFNVWMIPIVRALDQRIDEFRTADGIVIDLRGNLGGLGGMILGVSGHFLDERVSLGTLKMRGSDLSFFANPRRVNAAGERVTPYAGPLAILTDGMSLSAAEIFAGGMQGLGRARVFGETTGGQALPAIWDRLPNGDLLYHAFGDFVTSTNVRLEGRGVIPDERVPVRREDLLAGRDATLEAAMRWIAQPKK